MNGLNKFENNLFELVVDTKKGEPLFDVETVAKSLGFTEFKNEKEYVRWRTINGYLKKYVSQEVAKGDFIPESMVYKLAFKANNVLAEKFQDWLAVEVLPSIRKHGGYLTPEKIEEALLNPDTLIQLATNLKEERSKRLVAEQKVTAMIPKALFADAVAASHTSILIGELSKLISQNGVKIGQNRLFEWLRGNGYLIKRKGTDFNMPTQYSMELRLFEIKERTINNADGSIRTTKTPKVTGKGQQYFINKFLNESELLEG